MTDPGEIGPLDARLPFRLGQPGRQGMAAVQFVGPEGGHHEQPLGAGIGALVGGIWGAEACLYLAVAGFGVQMLVILMSQAVSLVRQPEMASD